MTAKVLFTGKTHTTAGRDGAARSSDGFLDIKLPQPHPAAENLFGAAWSACYPGRASSWPPPSRRSPGRPFRSTPRSTWATRPGAFFLQARLNVSLPGVERDVARGADRSRPRDLPLLQGGRTATSKSPPPWSQGAGFRRNRLGPASVQSAGPSSLSPAYGEARFLWPSAASRRSARHGGADQRLERRLIDRLALAEIDGAPRGAISDWK